MGVSNWVVGVLLATLASIVSNLGLNLQKLNHTQNDTRIRAQLRAARKAAAAASAAGGGSAIAHNGDSDKAAPPHVNVPATVYSGTQLPHGHPPLGSAGSRILNDSYQSSSSSSSSSSTAAAMVGSATDADEKQHLLNSSSSSSNHHPHPHHLSAFDALQTVDYTRQSLWRLGMSLVIVGSLLDFVALMFAAASIVAPLGSLTLVSNTLLAPLLLGESISRRDLLATAAIVAGSALAVIFADHRELILSVPELFDCFATVRFVVYAIVVCASVAALLATQRRLSHVQATDPHRYATEGFSRLHRFTYASLAGIVGAQSVLFAKCVGEILVNTFKGHTFLALYWQTYAIIAAMVLTIVAQVRWLNRGLQQWDALYIVPVFQSFWILTSVVGGMVFFDEWRGVFDAPGSSVFFPMGVLITVAGVYVLSQRGGGGAAAVGGGGAGAGGKGGSAAATPVPRNFKHFKPYRIIAAQQQQQQQQQHGNIHRSDSSGTDSSASPLSSSAALPPPPHPSDAPPPFALSVNAPPLDEGSTLLVPGRDARRRYYSELSSDDEAEYDGVTTQAGDLEAAILHPHSSADEEGGDEAIDEDEDEDDDVSFVSPAPPLPLMSAATAALIDAPLIGYSAAGNTLAIPRRGGRGRGHGLFHSHSQPSSWTEASHFAPIKHKPAYAFTAKPSSTRAAAADGHGSDSDGGSVGSSSGGGGGGGYQSSSSRSFASDRTSTTEQHERVMRPSVSPSSAPSAMALPTTELVKPSAAGDAAIVPRSASAFASASGFPPPPTAAALAPSSSSRPIMAEIDPADLLETSPEVVAQQQQPPRTATSSSSSSSGGKQAKKGKHGKR